MNNQRLDDSDHESARTVVREPRLDGRDKSRGNLGLDCSMVVCIAFQLIFELPSSLVNLHDASL